MERLERSRFPAVALVTGAAVSFVTFAIVAAWVEIDGSFSGDMRALEELYGLFDTALDDPMVAIGAATRNIPLLIGAAAVIGTLLRANRTHDAGTFLLIVGVAFVVNPILKRIFERARPTVRVSPEELSTFSFPSGHAAATAAIVGGLVAIARTSRGRRRVAIFGSAVVVLVGFSRVAIAVHYPSDIIAGWLWVSGWTLLVIAIRRDRSPSSTG